MGDSLAAQKRPQQMEGQDSLLSIDHLEMRLLGTPQEDDGAHDVRMLRPAIESLRDIREQLCRDAWGPGVRALEIRYAQVGTLSAEQFVDGDELQHLGVDRHGVDGNR